MANYSTAIFLRKMKGEEMKRFTLGKYSLDDFASYLDGAHNSYFEGIEGNQLVLEGEHSLTSTLNINRPLTISGGSIVGSGAQYAISITSSDVYVNNVTISGFDYGIEIDALGAIVSNVQLDTVHINVIKTGFEVGSSVNNSQLKDIRLVNCVASLPTELWNEDATGFMLAPYALSAARHTGTTNASLDNCILDGITMSHCKKLGCTRLGMAIMPHIAGRGEAFNTSVVYGDVQMHNVCVSHCHFDDCWDGVFNIVGGYIGNSGALVTNLEIAHNTIRFGIGGIYLAASEPMFGNSTACKFAGVAIHHNAFIKAIEDVGEPERAIFIVASRSDAFAGVNSYDNVVENVDIYNNTFEGAGIVIAGAYSMLDNQCTHQANVVNNINIHHNNIASADVAFTFDGCQLEGRMYDWNFGYPRHDMQWGEIIDDDSITTMTMIDNAVSNITCTDNTIEGYRYRIKASGANGHGHAVCQGNRVVDNIVFERNSFGIGENHLHVQDIIMDDYVRDNGGNKVSMAFKLKK